MRTAGIKLTDPALRGYSNPPRLTIDVEVNQADFKAWTFYVGRGDQFNEMSPNNLQALVEGYLIDNKEIWAVSRVDLVGLGTYVTTLHQFMMFQGVSCNDPDIKGGALQVKVNDELTLINGWSSRSDVFNTTGIYPLHVMEVELNNVATGTPYGTAVAPVEWVDRQVRYITAGFYAVYFTRKDGRKSYTIARTDKKHTLHVPGLIPLARG